MKVLTYEPESRRQYVVETLWRSTLDQTLIRINNDEEKKPVFWTRRFCFSSVSEGGRVNTDLYCEALRDFFENTF